MGSRWEALVDQSYIHATGQVPTYLRLLGNLVVYEVVWEGNSGEELQGLAFADSFPDYFVEVVTIYGHLVLARDEVRKWQAEVPHNLIHAKYHFYAFVYNTKAFLDKIAGFLNEMFNLRKRGGAVDLRREEFMSALRATRPSLAGQLDKEAKWIKLVSEWRDSLIHREGVWIGETMRPGVRRYRRASRQIHLPKEPESLFADLADDEHSTIRMPTICEKWLVHAEIILRDVSEDSANFVEQSGRGAAKRKGSSRKAKRPGK